MGTVGIALTFLTQTILKQTNPGFAILIPRGDFSAIALALVGAATGASTALRAATMIPSSPSLRITCAALKVRGPTSGGLSGRTTQGMLCGLEIVVSELEIPGGVGAGRPVFFVNA